MTEHRHVAYVDGCYGCHAAHSEQMAVKRAADAQHDVCLARWGGLTSEQRAGTTFHDWQAHLPTSSP